MTGAFNAVVVLQFAIAVLLPVGATALLAHIDRSSKVATANWWQRQIAYGLLFGLIAIYGTEAGIPTTDATMNVRDAAPLAAGLFFGGPAGIIAGIAGGTHRWFAALWGRGMFTRLACSAATVIAGFLGALLRKYVFERRRPNWLAAFVVGFSFETFHMLLIFVTNLNEVMRAYVVVRACNIPMLLSNAISLALCSVVFALVNKEEFRINFSKPEVSGTVRNSMLVVAVVGFFATLLSLANIFDNLKESGVLVAAIGDVDTRNLLLLVISDLEIIVLACIFAANYIVINYTVVRNVRRTNEQLDQISKGDLTVEVDVRNSVEFESLSDGINKTVGALRDAMEEETKRMEADLATARSIQESALPRTFPPFPDVDSFDIYASMSAAREVGGDFYDFYLVDEHTLGFLIADVSGKGIPAALFMMEAKAELSHYMRSGVELAEAVRSANWNLCRGNDKGMFVTVWAATLNYTTGELTYVNAGHNPPLLCHNGTWQWLKKRCGLFLGTFETAKYRQETLQLEPGDELLLYTDGVNEAFSADDEEYGNDRLERFLQEHTGLQPRLLVDSLRFDVRHWAEGTDPSDDITILCLEYGVTPMFSWSLSVPAVEEGLQELLRRTAYKLEEIRCPSTVAGEIGAATGALLDDARARLMPDSDGSDQVEFAYIFLDNIRTLVATCTDQGLPFDVNAHKLFDTGNSSSRLIQFGTPISVSGADEAVYVRDGNNNVVVLLKSW